MSESLKRGIDALLYLSTRKSVGVTELADELDVNKSTAFRILNTLLESGLVEKNKETATYKLGAAILRLSERYYKNFYTITVALPIMKRLSVEISESVHLAIASNTGAIVVEQVMCEGTAVNAKIGHNEPLHCSSVGKCLLTFSTVADGKNLLKSVVYDKYTDKTLTDEKSLLKEIEKIRKDGFAVDNGELDADIRCVAVPVYNNFGDCIYSLGVSGTANKMTDSRIEKIVPSLLRASKDMALRG